MYMKMNMIEVGMKSYKKQMTGATYKGLHDHQGGLCSICNLPADQEGLGGRYFPEHDDYLELCHWRCNPNNPKAKAAIHPLDTVEDTPIAGDFLKAFSQCKQATYPISYQRRRNYYKKKVKKT